MQYHTISYSINIAIVWYCMDTSIGNIVWRRNKDTVGGQKCKNKLSKAKNEIRASKSVLSCDIFIDFFAQIPFFCLFDPQVFRLLYKIFDQYHTDILILEHKFCFWTLTAYFRFFNLRIRFLHLY
jgi:hypothetical protein